VQCSAGGGRELADQTGDVSLVYHLDGVPVLARLGAATAAELPGQDLSAVAAHVSVLALLPQAHSGLGEKHAHLKGEADVQEGVQRISVGGRGDGEGGASGVALIESDLIFVITLGLEDLLALGS